MQLERTKSNSNFRDLATVPSVGPRFSPVPPSKLQPEETGTRQITVEYGAERVDGDGDGHG